MKIQVNMKISSNKEAGSSFDLLVDETDTVASIKERLSTLQLISFPDQDLLLNGEVLADARQLSDCGIKEPGTWSLDFVVKASESTIADQLKELLKARDLSCDELGLLYCYKHGVSITQALQTIGRPGEKLQDFVKGHKFFQLENNHVALVREDTSLKPFSVVEEVESILKASSTGSMEIKELCAKFVAKFHISLSSIAGMKPAEFLMKEREHFVVTDRRLVGLKSKSVAWKPQPRRSDSGGTDNVSDSIEPPPGLGAKVSPSAAADVAQTLSSAENQQYLDLHNKIFNRASQAQVQQALNDVVETVREASFLNVDRVVKGGAISKGTAISGCKNAEAVFFLPGLPPVSQERWLPPLLKGVASVLRERMEEMGVESIEVREECIQLRTKGVALAVDIRFSPVFGSYAETVKALAAQGPEARRFYASSLIEERVQFIARQPSAVKITIRLLKWWRDQQVWSNDKLCPSDDILELMAVYSSVQTKPQDQRAAIANVMVLLSRFNDLRIVWSNYYTKSDVWAPLLQQRPLLMDPLNPYVNIADPAVFDASELVDRARSTHFFW